jgi:hypothetical protein
LLKNRPKDIGLHILKYLPTAGLSDPNKGEVPQKSNLKPNPRFP